MTTTDKPSWQRATEIVPGRTYSWNPDGSRSWVARVVDHEGVRWWVSFMRADGTLDYYCSDIMPFEQGPATPRIVRTEYREPTPGELCVHASGTIYPWTGFDTPAAHVVLVIEPNPEYRS